SPVSSKPASSKTPANGATDARLEELSAAIESGSGLPALTRAAARTLDASVALIDRSSAVLAVAASSAAEEAKLLSGDDRVETLELRDRKSTRLNSSHT